jgi:hypothetical protein
MVILKNIALSLSAFEGKYLCCFQTIFLIIPIVLCIFPYLCSETRLIYISHDYKEPLFALKVFMFIHILLDNKIMSYNKFLCPYVL